jgi:hypothetical protein
MKRTKNIYTAAAVIAALAIGFVIGISINYPNVNNNEASGTIGKVNKYRDVQMSEADIQLRSDLLNDELIKKRYEDYYAMHYALAVEQSEKIDFALEAIKQNSDFENENETAIKQLTQFRESLNEPRAALLLAHSAVKNVSKDNVIIVTEVINNANISIAQINYNDNAITHFAEALNDYIQSNKTTVEPDILKALDLLTINLLTKAVLTNDKPMLKYLDKQTIYTDKENLRILYNTSELLQSINLDTERLNVILGQEKLNLLVILNSNENLKVSESLNAINTDINKLRSSLLNPEILKTGFTSQAENILGAGNVLDTEKLNLFTDKDFLNAVSFDTEFLKFLVLNQEKLGYFNHEVLQADQW